MRLRSRDDGSALVLALVFMVLFSTLVAVILDLAWTSFRVSAAIAEQGKKAYAADAAVEQAITWLRDPATSECMDGSSPPAAVPPAAIAETNGKTLTVDCTYLRDDGGSSDTTGSAGYTVQLLSPNADALTRFDGWPTKTTIQGNVRLNSNTVTFATSGTYPGLLWIAAHDAANPATTGGVVTATGSPGCTLPPSGRLQFEGNGSFECAPGPAERPDWQPPKLDGLAAAPAATVETIGGRNVRRFKPGSYATHPRLDMCEPHSAFWLTKNCPAGDTKIDLNLFDPGLYYFAGSFRTNGEWITDVSGWLAPHAPVVAGTLPAGDPLDPARGVNERCDRTKPGVSFVSGQGQFFNVISAQLTACAMRADQPLTGTPDPFPGVSDPTRGTPGMILWQCTTTFPACVSPPPAPLPAATDFLKTQVGYGTPVEPKVFLHGAMYAPAGKITIFALTFSAAGDAIVGNGLVAWSLTLVAGNSWGESVIARPPLLYSRLVRLVAKLDGVEELASVVAVDRNPTRTTKVKSWARE